MNFATALHILSIRPVAACCVVRGGYKPKKEKHMRKLAVLIPVAVIALAITGCVTQKKTTTIVLNKDGTTNSITETLKETSEPLKTKVVAHSTHGYGVKLTFSSVSGNMMPSLITGIFDDSWITIPTAVDNAGVIHTAPFGMTAHHNQSIINQADDKNMSSITNLPSQAYLGPNVSVLNPVPGGTVLTPTNSPTITTNTP